LLMLLTMEQRFGIRSLSVWPVGVIDPVVLD
jgi:hypothetical protein